MLAAKQKISGFGHRVYKTEDPRATHLRRMSEQLGKDAGQPKWFEMSRAIELYINADKKLNANVDFYSASTYATLGIDIDLYTPIFAISRIAGWAAHIIEQLDDNRLIRPRAEYIGPVYPAHWVPIEGSRLGLRLGLARVPELIEPPGSQRAAVANHAIQHHVFELAHGNGMHDEVVLLGVGVLLGLGQTGGEKNVLLLLGEAVSNPKGSQIGHFRGMQTGLFPQFAARQFFGKTRPPSPSRLEAVPAHAPEWCSETAPPATHGPDRWAG